MAQSSTFVLQRQSIGISDTLDVTFQGDDSEPIPGRFVVWSTGVLWLEATAYLAEKSLEVRTTGGSEETVASHASSLAVFATYLEDSGRSWIELPPEKDQRVTYLYRGHLIDRVEKQKKLRRSTAARHISVVKSFYKWAKAKGLLTGLSDAYKPRPRGVAYTNSVGLVQVKEVESSDLAISSSSAKNSGVEDGLHPLKIQDRNSMILLVKEHFSREFYLILMLGFYSGMRIETILGLTVKGLQNTFPSRELHGWLSLEVGGHSGIPTKRNVNYFPSIPQWLFNELLNYIKRPRRAVRAKKAEGADKGLVFLGQRGQKLTNKSFCQDMRKLKSLAKMKGFNFESFYFHCSRATFGTALVTMLMTDKAPTPYILNCLRCCMGHTNASTSLRYVQWVEDDSERVVVANLYSEFLGFPHET